MRWAFLAAAADPSRAGAALRHGPALPGRRAARGSGGALPPLALAQARSAEGAQQSRRGAADAGPAAGRGRELPARARARSVAAAGEPESRVHRARPALPPRTPSRDFSACCRRTRAMRRRTPISATSTASSAGTAMRSRRSAGRSPAMPELPEAHFARGLELLLCGEYGEGWREYEWRWRVKALNYADARVSPTGSGTASTCPGGTIVLHAEQGFGDTLQVVRYASLVAERCSCRRARVPAAAQASPCAARQG